MKTKRKELIAGLIAVGAIALLIFANKNGMKLKNKPSIGRISGRRWFGGNSGYYGYSKSVRAAQAEERGLRNLSQMDKAFAEEVSEILGKKMTLKEIKDAIKSGKIRPSEWHHTSKYGNRTNYYSAEDIAAAMSENQTNIYAAEQPKENKLTIPLTEVVYWIQDYEYKETGYKATNGLIVLVNPLNSANFYLSKDTQAFSAVDETGRRIEGYTAMEDYYYDEKEDWLRLEEAVSELKNVLKNFSIQN